MSQIFRAMKTEITQIRRFYASHSQRRNMRSYYETLRISPNASQQEIRLAFIELSKEMHPDTSKKTNHTEFVKILEAYKALSKKNTRQLYDAELKGRSSHGRPYRVVYYESEANAYNTWKPQYAHDTSNNYYGIRGIKRVSNLAFAFLCLMGSGIGVSFLMLVLSKAVAYQQDQTLAKNEKHQEAYDKVRAELSNLTREEEIEAFKKRSAAGEKPSSIQFQS